MSKKWMYPIAITAMLLLGATAFAQMGSAGPPEERPMRKRHMGPGAPAERPTWNRAEMWKRIEMMKMWKLTEALNLDEKTAAKLFPMIHDYDGQQWKLRKARHEIIRDMKAETAKEKPDPAALTKMIDAFKKNESDMVEARNKALAEFSKVLTKEQVAQMIIAIPRFEREMRERICEARAHRMGHGMGMRGMGMRGMGMQGMGMQEEQKECPCPMRPENCPLGEKGMKPGPAQPSPETE